MTKKGRQKYFGNETFFTGNLEMFEGLNFFPFSTVVNFP